MENNVLQAALAHQLDVWLLRDGEEDLALVTTTVQVENITGSRNLFLFSLYGFKQFGLNDWLQGLWLLRRVAIGKRCSAITAQTNSPAVIEIVKRFNGDVSYHLVKLEV